jgi:aminoglycoside/choline kinase family phosphotransferase
MTIEVELLLDWYLPFASGASATPAQREAFLSAWKPVFELLEAQPRTIALRDYHSPNLLWLPDRNGSASVGLIDFQDALIAPPGYDLASLLQDARLDVPADLETALIARFEAKATAANAAFDLPAFRFSYRALAAQRATKIIGIFARLALRDKKPGYLRHLPRMWRYLERDLAAPELAALRSWYDRELPPPLRVVTAKTGV